MCVSSVRDLQIFMKNSFSCTFANIVSKNINKLVKITVKYFISYLYSCANILNRVLQLKSRIQYGLIYCGGGVHI